MHTSTHVSTHSSSMRWCMAPLKASMQHAKVLAHQFARIKSCSTPANSNECCPVTVCLHPQSCCRTVPTAHAAPLWPHLVSGQLVAGPSCCQVVDLDDALILLAHAHKHEVVAHTYAVDAKGSHQVGRHQLQGTRRQAGESGPSAASQPLSDKCVAHHICLHPNQSCAAVHMPW